MYTSEWQQGIREGVPGGLFALNHFVKFILNPNTKIGSCGTEPLGPLVKMKRPGWAPHVI